MSRKYNTKHLGRGKSRYAQRLAKRGQTPVTVRMESLEVLEKRQERRKEETGVPWWRRSGYADAA